MPPSIALTLAIINLHYLIELKLHGAWNYRGRDNQSVFPNVLMQNVCIMNDVTVISHDREDGTYNICPTIALTIALDLPCSAADNHVFNYVDFGQENDCSQVLLNILETAPDCHNDADCY